ncbi:Aldose reductase A [Pseudolycoriella hygida]|uniref:Aldose reductase A n=1 Tax=Pseudolycoriella hygida TaxID=35572 RepID=A0A9Q0N556_9DIPT|nr:Aldose reductase A [Pseudolycoriella hygida]
MNKVFKLNSGYDIPLLGFGTYRISNPDKIYEVVDVALDVGYRHFDSAVCYRNESYIGEALRTLLPKYKLRREDIFITSKIIPAANQGEAEVTEIVKRSLRNLQIDYIDLYLIHWPGVSGIDVSSSENERYRRATWRTLSKLHKSGLCRSIGVSNYTVSHLEDLIGNCDDVTPSVNQVEWHPRYHQPNLAKFCRQNNIFLQAYSSLGTSDNSSLRNDPTVVNISEKLGRTSAQVLLRWAYQQNIGILPKASSRSHIQENFDLNFEISDEDLQLLNNLNVVEKYAWDPTAVL